MPSIESRDIDTQNTHRHAHTYIHTYTYTDRQAHIHRQTDRHSLSHTHSHTHTNQTIQRPLSYSGAFFLLGLFVCVCVVSESHHLPKSHSVAPTVITTIIRLHSSRTFTYIAHDIQWFSTSMEERIKLELETTKLQPNQVRNLDCKRPHFHWSSSTVTRCCILTLNVKRLKSF